LVKYEKNSESLQALKDGRGDGYAQDNFILFAGARKNPGFVVVPEKLEKEAPIAPAVKKRKYAPLGSKQEPPWGSKSGRKSASRRGVLFHGRCDPIVVIPLRARPQQSVREPAGRIPEPFAVRGQGLQLQGFGS